MSIPRTEDQDSHISQRSRFLALRARNDTSLALTYPESDAVRAEPDPPSPLASLLADRHVLWHWPSPAWAGDVGFSSDGLALLGGRAVVESAMARARRYRRFSRCDSHRHPFFDARSQRERARGSRVRGDR